MAFTHTEESVMKSFFYSDLAINPVIAEGIPEVRGLTLKNSVRSTSNSFKADIYLLDDDWTVCFWWKFEDYKVDQQPLISMHTADGKRKKLI